MTRHRHLRLINATPAANDTGGDHENAVGPSDYYAGPDDGDRDHAFRRDDRRLCPNQSRVFNYAHHRHDVIELNEKEITSRKLIFFVTNIDRKFNQYIGINMRKQQIVIKKSWIFRHFLESAMHFLQVSIDFKKLNKFTS